MKFISLVYLDTAFIAAAYEELLGNNVPTKITKTEDISGGINGGFIKAGVSSKETKEYPVSSLRMYEQVSSALNEIESYDMWSLDALRLPDIFWVSGWLLFASSAKIKDGKRLCEDTYFHVARDCSDIEGRLDLVANDMYFTSGYDQLTRFNQTLTFDPHIPIKALVRWIYTNPFLEDSCAVVAPLVMLRRKEDHESH
ncbi:MAG: hypothetical protein Q7Q73_01515 [Verrucomicrobiota bacterium JB024]|nr:hypothetical protein [Verrucomicrobiota bacterium JB024]